MNITITYHYIILILPLYAYLTYYYIDSYYYFITHFTRQAINWVLYLAGKTYSVRGNKVPIYFLSINSLNNLKGYI